jgi:hypothetical protein
MRAATAAEYLDMSVQKFRDIAAKDIPAFQFDMRGDRYYLREDLDEYLQKRRKLPVVSRKAA